MKEETLNTDVVDVDKQHTTQFRLEQDVFLQEERTVRLAARHNPLYLFVINLFSAVVIFFVNLVSLEMIISLGLSIGLTIYVFNRFVDDGNFDGSIMDFVVLSFAVITPLSNTIVMAFRRRESALDSVASIRATLLELYNAHTVWDWNQVPGNPDVSGRTRSTVNWLDHSDAVCLEMQRFTSELCRYLTLPSSTRARHKSTSLGRQESNCINVVSDELYKSIVQRLYRITLFCEVLKREGLPPNEASRIRQYERYMQVSVEKLKMIKSYRTPQALRSFARLFSMILPIFYAPYYAELGYRLQSLAMGIIFSVLTSVALTGLFETVSQFEDPFVKCSVLDGVQVKTELVDNLTPYLLALRELTYPDAPASLSTWT